VVEDSPVELTVKLAETILERVQVVCMEEGLLGASAGMIARSGQSSVANLLPLLMKLETR
jgi:hypothetical protein